MQYSTLLILLIISLGKTNCEVEKIFLEAEKVYSKFGAESRVESIKITDTQWKEITAALSEKMGCAIPRNVLYFIFWLNFLIPSLTY